jgi:opacity protein-like surface antigen
MRAFLSLSQLSPLRLFSSARRHTLMGVVFALGLSGCAASPEALQAAKARQSLLGLEKGALLSCAGVPNRTARHEGKEYLTYISSRFEYDYDDGDGFLFVGSGGRHFRSGFGFGFPIGRTFTREKISCEATFSLTDNKISQVTYNGSDRLNDVPISQCFPIIRNCVGPSPAL